MIKLAYETNEMKYVWMNEEDSLFAKQGSLVEVPYAQTSFYGSLVVKSMFPMSRGVWMNDMKDVMCYTHYFVCYMQYVMLYMQ